MQVRCATRSQHEFQRWDQHIVVGRDRSQNTPHDLRRRHSLQERISAPLLAVCWIQPSRLDGCLNDASNQLATIDVAYAITRRISALARSDEEIRFSGLHPLAPGWFGRPKCDNPVVDPPFRHIQAPKRIHCAQYFAELESHDWSADSKGYSEGLSTSAQDVPTILRYPT